MRACDPIFNSGMCDIGLGFVKFEEFMKLFCNSEPLFQNPDLLIEQDRIAQMALIDVIDGHTEEMMKRREIDKIAARENRKAIITDFTGEGKMTASKIKQIFQRFQAADVDHSGRIQYDEFLHVMQHEDSDVMRRLFNMFDSDNSGEIELREFIIGLSHFTQTNKEDRLRFAFKMVPMPP